MKNCGEKLQVLELIKKKTGTFASKKYDIDKIRFKRGRIKFLKDE